MDGAIARELAPELADNGDPLGLGHVGGGEPLNNVGEVPHGRRSSSRRRAWFSICRARAAAANFSRSRSTRSHCSTDRTPLSLHLRNRFVSSPVKPPTLSIRRS